jgi:tetratricopeptide (TPR) repeat protein
MPGRPVPRQRRRADAEAHPPAGRVLTGRVLAGRACAGCSLTGRARAGLGAALLAFALAAGPAGEAFAVESDPLPVPAAGPAAEAVVLYNEGVELVLKRRFREAQQRFEEALRFKEDLPEAHNNLAFVLRTQGPENFERALGHYNRAIELKPGLVQAWMYRGMLFLSAGDVARARADLARLRYLGAAALADELAAAIRAATDPAATATSAAPGAVPSAPSSGASGTSPYSGLAAQFD